MEEVMGSDHNQRIYTVAEIEAKSYKYKSRGLFVFCVGMPSGIIGLFMVPFVHQILWQAASAALSILIMLASMAIFAYTRASDVCIFVDKPKTLSVCKRIEAYPELHEEFCRIMDIRQVLTLAEYRRFKEAVDQIAASAADKATADELDAAVNRLRCGD
ncbi:hypothetical protein C3R74_11615 [Acidithiobacillus ferridurans]|uniref:hypothetical protein n=1 Tax=Acidithiobacillus ferridurans TaxID=1232575 RepID=UPI000DE26950|nr:hypothetical protein [Acidithiobacillus ferridurans]RBL99159.1 hypothetical protein C3R74_11615 [Acidithiobacillus ferridurans]